MTNTPMIQPSQLAGTIADINKARMTIAVLQDDLATHLIAKYCLSAAFDRLNQALAELKQCEQPAPDADVEMTMDGRALEVEK